MAITPESLLSAIKNLTGGGDIAKQFFVWGVLYGLMSNATAPLTQELLNKVNSDSPVVPISPADAATAALRGHMPLADAQKEAANSGIDGDRFNILYKNTGVPPSLQDMLMLFRRGEATLDQLHTAVQQSDVRDEWFQNGIIQKLGKIPPSPVDFLNALLQGQISEADARKLYDIFGGLDQQAGFDIFKILFDTRGSAPTPVEAVDMANRGIIPWAGTGPDATSYEQAFLEGPWRNKWSTPYRQWGEYLIPAETVATLLGHGAIDDTRAAQILAQHGMSQEDIAAYLSSAHQTTIDVQKQLAVSEISTLYYDQAIDSTTATKMLTSIGYSSGDAGFVLAIQDLRRERTFLESAITKIKTLYTDYKIQSNDVQSALAALKVPQSQISNLKTTWDLERAANIPHLTESAITSALYYGIMDQPTAMKRLEQLGYQPYDAWVLLSNRVHGVLPDQPPEG